jgi:hypothetical protein
LDDMNTKLSKYFELIAGSAFLFVFFGYFCGYSIMSSFLSSMFNLPVFFGTFFPPASILFLGYLIIFSFVLVLPLFYDLTIKRGLSDVVYLVMGYFLFGIWGKINFPIQIKSIYIPIWGTKVLIMIGIILVYYISVVIARKYFAPKKPKQISRFSMYFPISTLAIIGAFLLPFFPILYPVSLDFQRWNLLSLATSFYVEYIFTFTFLSVVLQKAIQYLRLKSKNKESVFLTLFKLMAVLLIFVYQFSSLIGDSIAKSYAKQKSGIFPSINLTFNKGIKVDDNSITGLKDVYLLSKDGDSYYVFKINPNKLYIIEDIYVEHVELNSSL